jgi:pimeloyl-ACP methyl ester carboxylesterase
MLIIEPDRNVSSNSVMLFLHGQGEAGALPNALPLVCVHQTPPFQALLGRLPKTVVIAPQAPPVPDIQHWNWRDHLKGIAQFLAERYAGRWVVATGFSRGGLGVIQLAANYPDSVAAWAAVDPQPPRDPAETAALLSSPSIGGRGWLRYGVFRNRDAEWKAFSADLAARLPVQNRGHAELDHGAMALEAYRGSPLSATPGATNLYEFLDVAFTGASGPG